MMFYGLKYRTEQVRVEYSSFILQPNKSSGKQFLIRTERLSVTNLLTLIYGENTFHRHFLVRQESNRFH
jgi:hypothetical protein